MTDDWALAQARQVLGQLRLSSGTSTEEFIAAALRDVARRCAEIVEDADVERCSGYERHDDGRATLHAAVRAIRAEFPEAQ